MNWHRHKGKGILLAAGALVGLFGAGQVLSGTNMLPTPEEKARVLEEMEQRPDVVDSEAVAAHIQAYEEAAEGARADYIAWLDEFNRSDQALGTLEWSEIVARSLSGPQTVEEAVETADAVLLGTVVDIEFRPVPSTMESYALPVTIVRISVQETVKGELRAGEEASIVLGGGPVPSTHDPSQPVMTYYSSQPLLLPGDSALLVLEQAERYPGYAPHYPGYFYPQGWTGINHVQNGLVIPLEAGAVRQELGETPVEEALAILGEKAAGN